MIEVMPDVHHDEEIAFQGFTPKEIDAVWDAIARMRRNLSEAKEGRLAPA